MLLAITLCMSLIMPMSGTIVYADNEGGSVVSEENKDKTAEDFYNDTFFSDQNACTSPRIIIWTGSSREQAKQIFWEKQLQGVNTGGLSG